MPKKRQFQEDWEKSFWVGPSGVGSQGQPVLQKQMYLFLGGGGGGGGPYYRCEVRLWNKHSVG